MSISVRYVEIHTGKEHERTPGVEAVSGIQADGMALCQTIRQGPSPSKALLMGSKSYIKTDNFTPEDVAHLAEIAREKLGKGGNNKYE